jgi:hypothetical protein
MRLLRAFVCLCWVLMAGQTRAQNLSNEFTSADARRLSAELTPSPYGTRSGADTIRKWKRQWMISAAALVAASMLDASSSWGNREANPALQQGGNRFGGSSAAIKEGNAREPSTGTMRTVGQKICAAGSTAVPVSGGMLGLGR